MRKTFYQYVVLFHPTDKQEEEGLTTKKVLVDEIFSSSAKIAEMQIIKKIPDEYLQYIETNQLEILLRPF